MKRLRVIGGIALIATTIGATCDGDPTAPPPDTCVEGQTMTIGTDVTGAVAGGDCALPDGEGRHGDSYAFSLETQSIVRFNINGTTETAIRIRDNSKTGEQDVAIHDNGVSQYQTFIVLKAGSYTLDIAADELDASGDYTIASTVLTPPEQPVGCIQPPSQWRFAAVGVTVGGILTANDCAGSGTARFDAYIVKMNGARKITVTTNAAAGGAVEIRNWETNASVATPGARGTPGDIVVNFGAPSFDYFTVSVLGSPGTGTISYTIKIE